MILFQVFLQSRSKLQIISKTAHNSVKSLENELVYNRYTKIGIQMLIRLDNY